MSYKKKIQNKPQTPRKKERNKYNLKKRNYIITINEIKKGY